MWTCTPSSPGLAKTYILHRISQREAEKHKRTASAAGNNNGNWCKDVLRKCFNGCHHCQVLSLISDDVFITAISASQVCIKDKLFLPQTRNCLRNEDDSDTSGT